MDIGIIIVIIVVFIVGIGAYFYVTSKQTPKYKVIIEQKYKMSDFFPENGRGGYVNPEMDRGVYRDECISAGYQWNSNTQRCDI